MAARASVSPAVARQLTARQRLFLAALAEEVLLRDPRGVLIDKVDDPARLARETAHHALDSAAAWVEHLGPLHDVEGVRRLLARDGVPISRQAVSKRRGLLALTTGAGRVVYPAFQFRGGAPLPGMGDVLAELPERLVSRWTVASWLVSPDRDLDGARPVDVLARGEVDTVVRTARGWASSLAA